MKIEKLYIFITVYFLIYVSNFSMKLRKQPYKYFWEINKYKPFLSLGGQKGECPSTVITDP
jgi:hypothetical protein